MDRRGPKEERRKIDTASMLDAVSSAPGSVRRVNPFNPFNPFTGPVWALRPWRKAAWRRIWMIEYVSRDLYTWRTLRCEEEGDTYI